MPKLTDTQLIVLSAAANRDDGAALPLPKSIRADNKTRTAALKGLLKSRLLAERPATRDTAVWRQSEDGQRLTLAITDAGRSALGDDTGADSTPAKPARTAKGEQAGSQKGAPKGNVRKANRKVATPRKKMAAALAVRPGTKQQILIDLLGRTQGATIEDAIAATGWQAHSVRGFISGALKKKLGLKVDSEKIEGRGRVYRIAG